MEKHDKSAYKLYKILLSIHQRDLFHSKWLLSIKDSLISSGNDILRTLQDTVPIPKNIAQMVKLKLIENFKSMYGVIQFLLLLNA